MLENLGGNESVDVPQDEKHDAYGRGVKVEDDEGMAEMHSEKSAVKTEVASMDTVASSSKTDEQKPTLKSEAKIKNESMGTAASSSKTDEEKPTPKSEAKIEQESRRTAVPTTMNQSWIRPEPYRRPPPLSRHERVIAIAMRKSPSILDEDEAAFLNTSSEEDNATPREPLRRSARLADKERARHSG